MKFRIFSKKVTRFFSILLIVALVAANLPITSFATTTESAEETNSEIEEANSTPESVPGEVIVVSESTNQTILSNALGNAFNDSVLFEMQTLFESAPDDTNIPSAVSALKSGNDLPVPTEDSTKTRVDLVRSSALNTKELIEALSGQPGIVSVEPNYIYHICSEAPIYTEETMEETLEEVSSEVAAQGSTASHTYNTPDFTSHQYMASDTINGINVPNWNQPNIKNSDENVIVAVIDSGIDYYHEDLKNVMWNEGENYPSLVNYGGGEYGYNSVAKLGAEANFTTNVPLDDNGHGTHCAGIIAAEWNDKGVSGIANGAKIMAIKAILSTGTLTSATAIDALNYINLAIEAGVNIKVISNSWGGVYEGTALAIAFKTIADKNVLITFASGNDSQDIDDVPTKTSTLRNIPSVVVVNATDKNGDYASFSNYGENYTDIAAPGVDILSTIPRQFRKADARYSWDIVSNNFDSNKPSGFTYWTTPYDSVDVFLSDHGYSGNALAIHLDTKAGFIHGNLVPVVNTSVTDPLGYHPQYLTFMFCIENSQNQPRNGIIRCKIKNTANGWNEITTSILSAESWKNCSIKLPEDTDYSNLSFEFTFMATDSRMPFASYGDTFLIDNIMLTNDGYAYQEMSGTSMACPVISGEAAILISEFPEESAKKIAARIIGGVTRIDNQKNKCVSGGIANLQYALKGHIAPVIFSTTVDPINSDLVTINGYFFGDDVGTLKVDNVPMPIEKWSDTAIIINMGNDYATKEYNIEVTQASEPLMEGHRHLVIGDPLIRRPGDFIMLDPSTMLEGSNIMGMTTLHGKVYISAFATEGGLSLFEYDPHINQLRKLFTDATHTVCSDITAYDGTIAMLTINEIYRDTTYELMTYEPYSNEVKQIKLTKEAVEDRIPRSSATIINYNGELLVIGGVDTQGTLKSIYELSPELGTIIQAGQLDAPRAKASCFIYQSKLYAIYGVNSYSLEKIDRQSNGSYQGTIISSRATPTTGTTIPAATAASYNDGVVITGPVIKRSFYEDITDDSFILNLGEDDSFSFTKLGKLFSPSISGVVASTICDGRYYVIANSGAFQNQIAFGWLDGFDANPAPGDTMPTAQITVGDLTMAYKRYIEYTGNAIKAADLRVAVVNHVTGTHYELGSVSYKANKKAGIGQFTIKALKTTDKTLKKAFAALPQTFTILKSELSEKNTEVLFDKKGNVKSVKYVVPTLDKKGNIKYKKYSVPKKEYQLVDGYIVISDTSKNYTGKWLVK